MDKFMDILWDDQAELLINKLKERQMDGVYCKTKEEALSMILEECSSYDPISWGGSITLDEIGLRQALRDGTFNLIDHGAPGLNRDEMLNLRREALHSDLFLTSTNAITIDGELVNADGYGNRLAALINGPNKVFVVSGMNKLVYSVEEGLSRIENIAGPANTRRLSKNTPCKQTSLCEDCRSADRICCNYVVTSFSTIKNRVKVFLIGESLGY